MADALAQQRGEQAVEGQQFGLRRRSGQPRLKTGDYILPLQIFGNQPGAAAQPAAALLLHRQRPRRGDAEQLQPIGLAPAVPGAARPPEALEPVQGILDVVALDQQRLAVQLDPRHGGGAAGLEEVAALDITVQVVQQRLQPGGRLAAHHLQAGGAHPGAEQAAVATALAQVVAQAPAAHPGDLPAQLGQRQRMRGIDRPVAVQQLAQEGLQFGRQLGEEHAEVLQRPPLPQRPAGVFRLHAAAVDQVQALTLAQQVVQVQVGLPQAARVHPRDGAERGGEYRTLRFAEQRLRRRRTPGVPQALGAVEKFEQQPAALARREAFTQQRRRAQPLLGQQARARAFAGEVALGLGAHQQLGQHRTPLPFGATNIALPRQHAQQAVQAQLLPRRQLDIQRQARRAAGPGQLGQGHRRAALSRRRSARRCHQASSCASSPR
ncbi:hypothetical protein D3C78_693530 [compost metagenome]